MSVIKPKEKLGKWVCTECGTDFYIPASDFSKFLKYYKGVIVCLDCLHIINQLGLIYQKENEKFKKQEITDVLEIIVATYGCSIELTLKTAKKAREE